MEALTSLLGLFKALWNTGNRWTRYALMTILIWPFLIVLVALTGSRHAVSIFTLISILATIIFLTTGRRKRTGGENAEDPCVGWETGPLAILLLLSLFKKGRSAEKVLATMIGTELLLGIYFCLVPITNAPWLIPLFVITVFALLFFLIGVQNKVTKNVVTILSLMLLGLTVMFYLGGEKGMTDKVNKIARPRQAQAQTYQQVYQTQVTQPSPIINSVDFPDGVDQQEFDLSPDGWVKVTLPPVKADVRISPPKGTIIKFWNGETIVDNGPDSANWLPAKIDRSIFYMRNVNGGKATIMVARK